MARTMLRFILLFLGETKNCSYIAKRKSGDNWIFMKDEHDLSKPP
jgi:hypothetical protein